MPVTAGYIGIWASPINYNLIQILNKLRDKTEKQTERELRITFIINGAGFEACSLLDDDCELPEIPPQNLTDPPPRDTEGWTMAVFPYRAPAPLLFWEWRKGSLPRRLPGMTGATFKSPDSYLNAIRVCSVLSDSALSSLPGSSVHGISQTRILERLPFPRDLCNPGIKPESLGSPALADWFFTTEPPEKPIKYLVILKH